MTFEIDYSLFVTRRIKFFPLIDAYIELFKRSSDTENGPWFRFPIPKPNFGCILIAAARISSFGAWFQASPGVVVVLFIIFIL